MVLVSGLGTCGSMHLPGTGLLTQSSMCWYRSGCLCPSSMYMEGGYWHVCLEEKEVPGQYRAGPFCLN